MPDADQPVDLTNCDREPIHILGKVQDYGCLIAVSFDWTITHVSINCADILGAKAETLIGTRFKDIFSADIVQKLQSHAQGVGATAAVTRCFAFPVFDDARLFDVAISQSGPYLIFEFEPRPPAPIEPFDVSSVQALISRVQRHQTIEDMAQEAAVCLREITGFDRVMAYRFNQDASGTVIAEAMDADQEPFLGLSYPASDIPKQARALYVKSPLRIIADVDGQTHPVVPEHDSNGDPLDLSLTATRAVSPIHLEYLRNMGVAASMSVSILQKADLWGLFACHHRTPRYLDYETRSAVELFVQWFNYELAQIEMSGELQELDRARSLHDCLMADLSDGRSLADVFEVFARQINDVIPFDGAAIYADEDFNTVGYAPVRKDFMDLVKYLNSTPVGQIFSTTSLVQSYPGAENLSDQIAGLLALPISRTPGDYLVLFRREIETSVHWAGNPNKPVDNGPNGGRLTPRRSFQAWKETIRGQSAPWRPTELRAADALRTTLLEVVLKLADARNALQQRAQEHQEVLIAELNHRVRNILNLIRGIVSQSEVDGASVESYRAALDGRIQALALAHDQITKREWTWTPLRGLLESEIRAFLTEQSSRIQLTGVDLRLSPEAYSAMALVMHELVTNSVKYGALSDGEGSVKIHVHLKPGGTAKISWREENGPPVKAPSRRGFGSTIIERAVPFELKGSADLRYSASGFEADFELPPHHVRSGDSPAEPLPAPTSELPSDFSLSGDCLLVEDNIIIALGTTDMLTDLGASHVHSASRVPDALQILDHEEIECAVVDVNLGDDTSFLIVERCLERQVPVLLATGYGASSEFRDRFSDLPVLTKPISSETLKLALCNLLNSTKTDTGS